MPTTFLVALFVLIACDSRAAEDYRAKFIALADDWEAKGKTVEAKVAREWLPPEKGRQVFYLVEGTEIPAVPERTRPEPPDPMFMAEFRKLREAYAEELFAAALNEINTTKGESAAAFQLLHHVVRENPNHQAARKILGHELAGKVWKTDFSAPVEVRPAAAALPKVGWKKNDYSRVISPHFEVATNGPAVDAKKVAAELEQVYCVWRQMFFAQLARPGALAARAKGVDEPLFKDRKTPHRVVLFKLRPQYLEALKPGVPTIEMTTGIYSDLDQQSYFYISDPRDRLAIAARYHELVHQLLQENLGGGFIPGNDFNFWAVEGIAAYFESLARGRGFISLGGWEADRLQFARYRTLNAPAWPMKQLMAVGKDEWQGQELGQMKQLYAKSAGMSQFLLNSEAKSRTGFLDFIGLLYQNQNKLSSLPQLTGMAAEELDAKFVDFLQVTDRDLAEILEPERLRNLVLGRTKITDAGLASLKSCTNLEWLDLSGANVSDEGLKVIGNMPSLKQLFAEKGLEAECTPASLPLIVKLKNLEDLDLSGWEVQDNDLRQIAQMKNLKTLFLDRTQITDAGLMHLRTLPKLERLDTDKTLVTPEGRKRAGFPP